MEIFISPRIERLIAMALEEDEIGLDATSQVFFGDEARASARLVAKQDLVVSGQRVARAVFRRVDEAVDYQAKVKDGDSVAVGDVIALIEGPAWSLLVGERTALNFLQRMCGVATLTGEYVEALGPGTTRVVDTRKTLPGWRELDKYAVRCGGGFNHRFNLSAGVMIKENHIFAAGSVAEAIAQVRAKAPHTLRVEVEVEEVAQLSAALDGGADIILLDNMTNAQMAEAIAEIRGHRRGPQVLIEASGNMNLERLKTLAGLGLDLVSVGALTHSVKAADISMRFDGEVR